MFVRMAASVIDSDSIDHKPLTYDAQKGMMSMSRRPLLIVLAALSLLMIMLVSPVYGWAGGGGNNNYEYGDCSCHNVESSASLDMTASSSDLTPGAEVTVTVTV